MNNAISYARVSSVEQRERGLSIEAQIRFIRKYARDHDLKIVREFVEVETAKVTGRPRFLEMFEFLKETPGCKIILVEKTDRLYRNFQDMVDLDNLGVDIHFTKEGAIVGPNARSSDKFMHGIRVLMAKNYSDNLSEEVRKGLHEKVLRGEWPHGAPWGYKNNRETHTIDIDPAKSAFVKWLFKRYAVGDISVKRLHEEYMAFNNGIVLGKSYISKILSNPFYKGQMLWKGSIYPAVHEPLIDTPTWETVQLVLDASSKPPYARRYKLFTYSRLIKCCYCGCSIVGEIKKGKYIYYHCSEKRGPCKENGYIRQELLDEQFLAAIRKLKMDDNEFEDQMKAIQTLKEKEKADIVEEEQCLRNRIKEVQTELEMLYRKQRDLSSHRFAIRDEHDSILEELSDLTERLKDIQTPRVSIYTDHERLLDFANRAVKLFLNGTLEIRRKVIETMFEGIVMEEGQIQVKPKIQPVSVENYQQ